ncbi:hypothetical protein GCM10023264_16760 [Sphingomonas daechungensis]
MPKAGFSSASAGRSLRLALPCRSAYIRPMSWFPKPVGPRAAFADLRAFMRQRSREQFIGAALAVLVTAVIVFEFLIDSRINTAPPQQIVYAQSWSADRTDAEIVAQQKVDQAKKDAAAKEKQRQFQKLEKQLGM